MAILEELADREEERDLPKWLRAINKAILFWTNLCGKITSLVRWRPRRPRKRAGGTESSPCTVLIASHRWSFQRNIKRALRAQNEIVIVGTIQIGEERPAAVQDADPNVIIMDWSSTGMGGLSAICLLREQFPEARFIAVSPWDTKSLNFALRECGADELLLGPIVARDLVQAVERAIRRF